MANTYLTKTLPDAHGGVYKWTYSFWVKRGTLGTTQVMIGSRNSGTYYSQIKFTSADDLEVNDYRATSYALQKVTDRKFRDTSAWYHIVISNDNSVSSPDLKIYVNGVEETSFSTDNEYSQNQSTSFNNSYPNYIGQKGTGDYFDGSMSHFHFIDGTAYDASAFGEYDANGVWKINTSPSVTYGSQGYFILKDGNSVTDQSGNSNNFTVGGGTLTNTEDCPSSVFATANPLQQNSTMLTFTNGNNTVAEPSGNSTNWTTRWGMSTLAFSSGKFYAEAKISDIGSQQLYPIGIVRDEDIPGITSSVGTNGYGLYINDGRIIGFGNDIQTGLGSFSTNDIIGLADDADNRTFQYYKNGSTLGSQVTNITAGTYFFTSSAYANHGIQFNFGNGYFGTTAVASAGTNASNNGIFEYDVPSGYTALSTKGLNL